MTVLRLTTHADGPITIVELVGELNLATAPDLAAHLGRLLHEGRRYLVLDMSGLHSCDAAGMDSLRGGLVRTQLAGGVLRLAAPGEEFTDLVEPRLRRVAHADLGEAVDNLRQALADPPAETAASS